MNFFFNNVGFLEYEIKSIQDLKFWLGITWNTDSIFFTPKKGIHKIVLK